ncbi:unnamed protein product [Caenorhabditis bovis]|uniref:Uncharacterized protein n=1 Tax=Caenorhabditis bovis TaxID=2654633 RepID=A0A8S1ED82_9PELO|nr:unnamed protein product [Caenorhabditis bovis]
MGLGTSRSRDTVDEFDTLTIWGGDIDEAICGRGKICSDEWTPISSTAGTPRRMSAITVQPLPVANNPPRMLEEPLNILTIEHAPVEVREWRSEEGVEKKRRKMRKVDHRRSASKKVVPPLRIRRITVYPAIPPPTKGFVMFRRTMVPKEKGPRRLRAVPPRHLKGLNVTPPRPFRYKRTVLRIL